MGRHTDKTNFSYPDNTSQKATMYPRRGRKYMGKTSYHGWSGIQWNPPEQMAMQSHTPTAGAPQWCLQTSGQIGRHRGQIQPSHLSSEVEAVIVYAMSRRIK